MKVGDGRGGGRAGMSRWKLEGWRGMEDGGRRGREWKGDGWKWRKRGRMGGEGKGGEKGRGNGRGGEKWGGKGREERRGEISGEKEDINTCKNLTCFKHTQRLLQIQFNELSQNFYNGITHCTMVME